MQESYHNLTTNKRQLLFKVFRESKFYNFVDFLNHVEEIYGKSYEEGFRDNFEKVQKVYTEGGRRIKNDRGGK